VSLPQISIAAPRINMLAPIVIMIKRIGLASFSGLIANRSNVIPATVAISIDKTIAGKRGKPQKTRKNTVNIPPSITNSPCAKLMIPVAL